ncbi:hypothetical protein [Mucilaginibacter paludis]|uniref:hypothetical protein n=1 Tax=Mucilaginibacter paludis TaxID=423351 RepID=UPI0002555C3D|nr:hypothetical protein [Mucilaginibacter paludis]
MSIFDKVVKEPCNDCKALVGCGRYDRPHWNLKLTEFKPVDSMFGAVDESYYSCRTCGKEWLHETGNYGQGWVE